MKLSKTAWLVLGIGIFVISMAGLYMVYSQQTSEQKRLNDRLAVAQSTFPGLVTEQTDWEEQVADLESQLAQLGSELNIATILLNSTAASFPYSTESIEYDEILFQFADEWQLEIAILTASEPRDKDVEGIIYSVTSFMITVQGQTVQSSFTTPEEYIIQFREYTYRTVGDILNFVSKIATGADFTTATVESVTISIPEPLPLTDAAVEEMIENIIEQLPEEPEEGEVIEVEQELEKPSAVIELVIYNYQGE